MGFAEIILGCYALGSFCGFLGLLPRFQELRKPAAWLFAGGFAAHTVLILSVFLSRDIAAFTRGHMLQIMAWSLVFVYCATWWRLRFPILGLTAGPLALALFVFASTADALQGGLPVTMTGAFFVFHLGVLSLSFALMALGMGSALYFLTLHRKLKAKKIPATSNCNTPSLARVDALNRRVLLWTFILFTLGLISGFGWALAERGTAVTSDPKEITSILLWLLYAFAFMQRFVLGRQGRKTAVMLIVLFVATVIALLSVNLFMDSHHNFFQPLMFGAGQ